MPAAADVLSTIDLRRRACTAYLPYCCHPRNFKFSRERSRQPHKDCFWTMNNKEALSFYLFSTRERVRHFEPRRSGWSRHVIYRGRHVQGHLGYNGTLHFIKLSDGRVVATNDLWEDLDGWVSAVPNRALIGYKLATKWCRPKSKDALSTLMSLLEYPIERRKGFDSTWRIRSGLCDAEAYKLSVDFPGNQFPAAKTRKLRDEHALASFSSPKGSRLTHIKIGENKVEAFQGPKQLEEIEPAFVSFASPEGSILTHTKIGKKDIEAFKGPDQLESVDPTTTPVIILYEDPSGFASQGLQKGDSIAQSYVYDFPEWYGFVI